METKNTKGAMEMSVGTIVTIVLLMSVLVLGIFFVSKIFTSSNNAIDSIDSQVQSEINQLFSDGKADLAVYPSSRKITVERGAVPPQGFAFSVYNNEVLEGTFEYKMEVSDIGTCQGAVTKEQAVSSSYLLGGSGSFPLKGSQSLSNARLVTFPVAEGVPACTIVYNLIVSKNGKSYDIADLQITFK